MPPPQPCPVPTDFPSFDRRFRAITTLHSILNSTIRNEQLHITQNESKPYTQRVDALAELLSRSDDETVSVSVRFQRSPDCPIVYLGVSSKSTGEETGPSTVTVQGVLPSSVDITNCQLAHYLLKYPAVSFEHHAAVLMDWMKRSMRHSTSHEQEDERIERLNHYMLFRHCPKLLVRLEAGKREGYLGALEEVERRWESGELTVEGWSGEEAGFRGGLEVMQTAWTLFGILKNENEKWPALRKIVTQRARMEEEVNGPERDITGDEQAGDEQTSGFTMNPQLNSDNVPAQTESCISMVPGNYNSTKSSKNSTTVSPLPPSPPLATPAIDSAPEQEEDELSDSSSNESDDEPSESIYTRDPVYTAATSRDFNAFLMHILNDIINKLTLLAAYTRAPSRPDASDSIRKELANLLCSLRKLILIVYSLIVSNQPSALQSHLDWVSRVLQKTAPQKQARPSNSPRSSIPPPGTFITEYLGGRQTSARFTTWAQSFTAWLHLIYQVRGRTDRLYHVSGQSVMRCVIPTCSLAVIRPHPGAPTIEPWESVLSAILPATHTAILIPYLLSLAHAAPKTSPLKQLLPGNWIFRGTAHALATVASLKREQEHGHSSARAEFRHLDPLIGTSHTACDVCADLLNPTLAVSRRSNVVMPHALPPTLPPPYQRALGRRYIWSMQIVLNDIVYGLEPALKPLPLSFHDGLSS